MVDEIVLNAESQKRLVITEGCRVLIEGVVQLEAIEIRTEGRVDFVGDTLIVKNPNRRQPAIGGFPRDNMSYDRWALGNVEKIDIHFDLDQIVTESTTPNFSIGCYGYQPVLRGHLNVIFSARCDYSGVQGVDAVDVELPDKRNDSTKMSEGAIYLTQCEVDAKNAAEEAALMSKKSNFKSDGTVEECLLKYSKSKDFGLIETLMQGVQCFQDIGRVVGAIANFCDNSADYLKSDMLDDRFWRVLFEAERECWSRASNQPRYFLVHRALICYNDACWAAMEHSKSVDRGVFLNELDLNEDLHELFFRDLPFREYRLCARFIYGMNVFEDTDNSWVAKGNPAQIASWEKAGLVEKVKPMEAF